MTPRRIEPIAPRGFADHLPQDQAERQALVDVVRRIYEAHGFVPLGTPAVERLESLTGSGGDEANASIFRVETPDGDEFGLRYDLTLPTARVVAANQQDLPRPFRRWQFGTVWRLDKPGPGRFREFTQLDADIVGTTSAVADAQVVAAARDVLEAIVPTRGDVPRYAIRISDRRLLDALIAKAGIDPARSGDILRVVDKLDRLGAEKVRLELTAGYRDESGAPIEGLGLADAAVDVLAEFLAIPRDGRRPVIDRLSGFFAGHDAGLRAVEVIAGLAALLDALGVSEAQAAFDPAIARGLAYYTGPVFEFALLEAPSYGSVGSGGRYDDLVGRFSGQAWPGVGVSIGIDRLLVALQSIGAAPAARAAPDVLVTTMDVARLADYAAMADELRAAGLRVELYAGTALGFAKQMKHADRCGAPVTIIAGEDEFAKGVVTVKRMLEPAFESDASREEWLAQRLGQRVVPRKGLVEAVRSSLEGAP
jgi:histidyl-tRNA synthetase